MRQRYQKTKRAHFCLLVNKKAANYSPRPISQLIRSIKSKNNAYTVIEPESAMELYEMAQICAGVKRDRRSVILQRRVRGNVTALVACGGDGTFNLVARAALKADMPVGVLPIGRYNNIARSLCPTTDLTTAINKIGVMKYRLIDAAEVANQVFFGSVGVGFIPELTKLVNESGSPRFQFSWGRYGAKATAATMLKKQIIKVDSFRFEIRPRILNVNLIPYTAGLKLSPVSILDDKQAEIIFDTSSEEDLSDYMRQVYKGKQLYGSAIRQFRGTMISFQPTKGETLYLDGELITLPTNVVEIRILKKRLKVFC